MLLICYCKTTADDLIWRKLTWEADDLHILKENKLDKKAKLYEAKAQAVRDAFYHHPECYDEATEQFGTGSQASYAIALFSGMAEEHEEQAVKALVEAVTQSLSSIRAHDPSSHDYGSAQYYQAKVPHNSNTPAMW